MDFPIVDASPPFIHSLTRYMTGGQHNEMSGTVTPGAFAWAANVAVYMPLNIPWPYPVQRLFWINGSTASSNVDIGIYREDGTSIYRQGSTAQSGASVVQYVTPGTPFLLPPGRYYLGWTCSGTTTRAFGNLMASASGQLVGKMCGYLSQASALPLPATATFAAFTSTIGMPIAGITRLASGF